GGGTVKGWCVEVGGAGDKVARGEEVVAAWNKVGLDVILVGKEFDKDKVAAWTDFCRAHRGIVVTLSPRPVKKAKDDKKEEKKDDKKEDKKGDKKNEPEIDQDELKCHHLRLTAPR